ncbi:hypothetical protein BDW71DRAFT_201570 [Aspergillus fruticulosus]
MATLSDPAKSKPYFPLAGVSQDGWSHGDRATATCFWCMDNKYLTHERGRQFLSSYSQSKTVGTGNTMTNYFCSTCGSLMYRVGTGFPGMSILRIGTVDDFSLHEGKLKPRIEQFVKDRVTWLRAAEGVEQVEGYAYA